MNKRTIPNRFLALEPAGLLVGVVSAMVAVVVAVPALALKPAKDELERLQQCELDMCQLMVERTPDKGPLRCNVGKTWVKKDIKKGAGKKKMSWTSGDAQCSLKVKLDRAEVVGALTKPEFEVRLKRHYVNCLVEGKSGVDKVRVSLAPKLKFNDGKVQKIWLNIKEVEGPAGIKTLVWTAANLQDGLGIFHGEMIEEVNEFIYKKCHKRLKAEKKKARKAAKAKRKKEKAEAKKAETDSKKAEPDKSCSSGVECEASD